MLNILCAKYEKTSRYYFSKHNSNRVKQIILLMIPNGERCDYLAVKILNTLLRGITWKHHCDYFI